MYILTKIFYLIFAHLIGDFVLQNDYIVSNKGKNFYILAVHSILYCIPFVLLFSFTWQLIFIVIAHFVIDMLKARYKLINFTADQILHYMYLLLYFL